MTAVDISPTALQRGETHAAHAGPDVAGRITWLQSDLTGHALPTQETYDLVSAQFMHLPSAQRQTLHRRLAAVVSPGGTLLIVGHHPSDIHADIGRWDTPDLMHTADQVAAVLDPELWDMEVNESRPRTITDDQGVEKTVHDTVLRARRRTAAQGRLPL